MQKHIEHLIAEGFLIVGCEVEELEPREGDEWKGKQFHVDLRYADPTESFMTMLNPPLHCCGILSQDEFEAGVELLRERKVIRE